MVVVAVLMLVMMLVLIVLVMVMMMLVVPVVMVLVVVVVLVVDVLEFAHPCGRRGHLLEVEGAGVEQIFEGHVAVVRVDDFRLGLEGADDGADAAGLFLGDLIYLVEQYDVAELNLVDDETLDALLVGGNLLRESVAAAELCLESQGVDDRADAVETRRAVFGVFGVETGHETDGLGDGLGLADAAGLDDDIVELVVGGKLGELLDEVGAQRAADASVLEGHQVVLVAAAHDAALLDELGVDVHFAQVIDNHGKAYVAFVGEDAVQQRRLAAAEITGEQKHRRNFLF